MWITVHVNLSISLNHSISKWRVVLLVINSIVSSSSPGMACSDLMVTLGGV